MLCSFLASKRTCEAVIDLWRVSMAPVMFCCLSLEAWQAPRRACVVFVLMGGALAGGGREKHACACLRLFLMFYLYRSVCLCVSVYVRACVRVRARISVGGWVGHFSAEVLRPVVIGSAPQEKREQICVTMDNIRKFVGQPPHTSDHLFPKPGPRVFVLLHRLAGAASLTFLLAGCL